MRPVRRIVLRGLNSRLVAFPLGPHASSYLGRNQQKQNEQQNGPLLALPFFFRSIHDRTKTKKESNAARSKTISSSWPELTFSSLVVHLRSAFRGANCSRQTKSGKRNEERGPQCRPVSKYVVLSGTNQLGSKKMTMTSAVRRIYGSEVLLSSLLF